MPKILREFRRVTSIIIGSLPWENPVEPRRSLEETPAPASLDGPKQKSQTVPVTGTHQGSCNLLRRVLRRFFKGSAFLEAFLEGTL